MGKKPLSCVLGVFAAGLLLTGCESSGSKKPMAQTSPPAKPYGTANNGMIPSALDKSANGPPPSVADRSSSNNNVIPAGYSRPAGQSNSASSNANVMEGTPVGSNRANGNVTLGTPAANRGAAAETTDRSAMPAGANEAATTPPQPELPGGDAKLTLPAPPTIDNKDGKSMAPPSLAPVSSLKPSMP